MMKSAMHLADLMVKEEGVEKWLKRDFPPNRDGFTS
jgi:hypothetical protein